MKPELFSGSLSETLYIDTLDVLCEHEKVVNTFISLQYFGTVDFPLSPVVVRTGLIAACGENTQPSLIVLFRHGLRVLYVLKRRCCSI